MSQSNQNQYYGYQQPQQQQAYTQARQQPVYQNQPMQQPVYQAQPVQQQAFQPAQATPQAGYVPPQTLAALGHGMLPMEQSFIENILRLNAGKLATIYATFENNSEWNARIFKGIIEAAGRDHVILSDPETGTRYLIPMIYLDYVTFDEEIEYDYPQFGSNPGLTQYNPR